MRHAILLLAAVSLVGAAIPAEAQVVVVSPNPQYPRAAAADFSPRSGPPGTRVTIRGNGFSPYTQVLVGGQPVGTYGITQNQLEFVIPPGTWDGRIQLRSPGMPDFFVGQFQVTQGFLFLDDFRPYGGAPGTRVRITGRGFQPGVHVYLAGQEVSVMQLSGTFLDVVVPQNARTDYFTVILPNGQQLVSPRPFVVSQGNWMPQVSGFYPQVAQPGQRVTIVGNGFFGGAQVFVGSAPAQVVHITAMSIDFVVPQTYDGRIVVRFPGMGDVNVGALQLGGYPNPGPLPPGPNPYPNPNPPPGPQPIDIGSVTPDSGTANTLVRIYGTGFGREARAYYGAQEMQVTQQNATMIEAYIPAGAQSSEFIVVRDRFGQGRSPRPFRLTAPQPPPPNPGPGPGPGVGLWFEPRGGGPGTQVELYGRRFRHADMVTLGGIPVQIIDVDRDRIRVIIPQNAQTGRFAVYRGGWMVASSTDVFQFRGYGGGGQLEVWRLAPDEAWPGQEVKVKGRGFSNNVRVYFGNLPCAVTRVDRDEVRFIVPEGARGAQYITIEDNGQRVQTREALEIRHGRGRDDDRDRDRHD